MPVEQAKIYICSHCQTHITVRAGEEPKPWLCDREGNKLGQGSQDGSSWLLRIGRGGGEDLCPKCAAYIRKQFFPAIDDIGSWLGSTTRLKIRVVDLLQALVEEWGRQIDCWPVEGADFDGGAARKEVDVDAACEEAMATCRARAEKEEGTD